MHPKRLLRLLLLIMLCLFKNVICNKPFNKMNHTNINRIIYKHFGIKRNLTSFSLKTIAVKARFAAMLLCSEELGYSLHQIRRAYKRKSHSSIHHALVTARNLCETDKKYRQQVALARADVRYMKTELKRRKQRYNLHYRLRQKGVTVNTPDRMISITPEQEMLITASDQPQKLLSKHNYLIQYQIF
jgi:hypothetical protein